MELSVFFFILLFHIQSTMCKELIESVVDSSCQKFSDKILAYNCTKGYLDGHPTVSVELTFRDDMKALRLKANVRTYIGKFRKIEYRNLRLDLCDFLKITTRSNVMGFLVRGLQESARNFPDSCPFKKNTPYAFKDFALSSQGVPGVSGRNKLSVSVEAYEDNTKLLQFKVVAVSCLTDKPVDSTNGTNYCHE